MTFSICVRETYIQDDEEYVRFGVAATTNNPGVGNFIPFVSESGAVATQAYTTGELGPRLIGYLEDGLHADDAVPALVSSADSSHLRQVHAVGADSRGVHHGSALNPDNGYGDDEWEPMTVYGDRRGENYSVAGNCLANDAVLDAVARSYESADTDKGLADRLLDTLEAGDEAGGDKRDIDARSAVVQVVDPGAKLGNEWYNCLQVDASTTPLDDLRNQYQLAKDYHTTAAEDGGW